MVVRIPSRSGSARRDLRRGTAFGATAETAVATRSHGSRGRTLPSSPHTCATATLTVSRPSARPRRPHASRCWPPDAAAPRGAQGARTSRELCRGRSTAGGPPAPVLDPVASWACARSWKKPDLGAESGADPPLRRHSPSRNSTAAATSPASTSSTKTRSLIRPRTRLPTQAPAVVAGTSASPSSSTRAVSRSPAP